MLTLRQLKGYLQTHPAASLAELSVALKEEPSLVRMMLQHFISKGQVKVCMKTPKCGTQCQQCPTAQVQWFEWQACTESL